MKIVEIGLKFPGKYLIVAIKICVLLRLTLTNYSLDGGTTQQCTDIRLFIILLDDGPGLLSQFYEFAIIEPSIRWATCQWIILRCPSSVNTRACVEILFANAVYSTFTSQILYIVLYCIQVSSFKLLISEVS